MHGEEAMAICRSRNSSRSLDPRIETPQTITRRGPVSSAENSGPQPIRLLRLAQVIQRTGLRKTKLYELQASGAFPMRVQITAHSVGWVEAEVHAWLIARIAARAETGARFVPAT